MSETTPAVKNRFVPLRNIVLLHEMAKALIERSPLTDRIGGFYGRSGEGKTMASIYVRSKTRARLIEVGDSWDRKTFLRNILIEAGVADHGGTIARMTERVINALGDEPNRPLIIDEADKLVDKRMIEIVRELHDKARVPVILIGEERLPDKLASVERIHNRVLFWTPAQPCDLDDCRKLAAHFVPGVSVEDALLEQVLLHSAGRARRIVATMINMDNFARTQGLKTLSREGYGGGFVSGSAPRRVLPKEFVGGR